MIPITFRKNIYDYQSVFLIFLSFFGLFFLLAMYLWAPSSNTYYIFQEHIVLSIFIVICILGFFAAIYPSNCKRLIKFQEVNLDVNKNTEIQEVNLDVNKNTEINRPTSGVNIIFEGHHPDCGHFKHHTFKIRGRKYCPGCAGLLIGAIIAVLGTFIYSLSGFLSILPSSLLSSYNQYIFPVGVLTVFLALFLIVFFNLEKKLKFVANLALVVGSFLMLIGIVEVKGNFIMELYLLILVILLILTRIRVSESYHDKICQDCLKISTCIYESEK